MDLCLELQHSCPNTAGKLVCSSIKRRQLLVFTEKKNTSARDLGLRHQDTWAVWRRLLFRNECFLSKYGSYDTEAMTIPRWRLGAVQNVQHLPKMLTSTNLLVRFSWLPHAYACIHPSLHLVPKKLCRFFLGELWQRFHQSVLVGVNMVQIDGHGDEKTRGFNSRRTQP